jgi:CheY-like chemotaxis protein
VICKRLVEMMGGGFKVISTLGQGSIFMFNLHMCWNGGELHPSRPRENLRGMRVLVVDDNVTSLEILHEIFNSWSFQAVLASSGEAALLRLQEAKQAGRPFELYLIDWKMPGMDGVELARRIQAIGQSDAPAPILLMVSTQGRDHVAVVGEDVRLDAILDKPVTASSLYDAIIGIQGYLPEGLPRLGLIQTQNLFELTRSIHGGRVLLVDDNATNQLVATGFLTKMGLHFDVANDGREAVFKVAANQYDVVLMDLQMPVMDGFEATKQIRSTAKGRNLPILAMTAAAMVQDRQATEIAGMNGHLAKPIDTRELASALLKWVPRQTQNLTQNQTQPVIAVSDPVQEVPSEGLPFDIPGLDVVGAASNLGDDWELLRDIMLSFHAEFADAEQRLAAHIDAGEWLEAKRMVHTIKGLASSVGSDELHETSKRLEQELAEHQCGLQAEFNRVLSATLTALATLKSVATSVASGSEAGSAPPVSAAAPEHLRDLLQRLADHLAASTVVPNEFKVQVTRALVGHVEAALTDELISHVNHLDYESAQVTLNLLAQRLGVSLEV